MHVNFCNWFFFMWIPLRYINLRHKSINWPMIYLYETCQCTLFVVNVDTNHPKSWYDIHGPDLGWYFTVWFSSGLCIVLQHFIYCLRDIKIRLPVISRYICEMYRNKTWYEAKSNPDNGAWSREYLISDSQSFNEKLPWWFFFLSD